MEPGMVIGERFELVTRAGAGGMATIYRARDRLTGDLVAIKVLDGSGGVKAERFEREARVLAELSHPALVRYIAHGVTEAGAPYLVMEWLEGSDLGQRLMRGPIGVAASIAMVRRAAEALAVAHARGIIHRDVKPSNLFLVDERTDRVKVVDFGLARPTGTGSATATGTSIGTPRYMAPEQVRGRRHLDARVDVYALGGVLFASIAGRPPFIGADSMAILAEVLMEAPPLLRELVPEVPVSLELLIDAMLAKKPADRPDDAAAVIAALDAVTGEGHPDSVAPAPAAVAVTGGEQRLLSVVLVDAALGTPPVSDDDTALTRGSSTGGEDLPPALRYLLAGYGGRYASLPDGSLVVTMSGTGSATDQSALAARLALSIREQLPRVAIALATGRGQVERRQPTGDVIDRAARLLRQARDQGRHPIVIDDVTDGLLVERFAVRHTDTGTELVRERESDPARTLLGRVTPCVGRDAELSMLEAVWRQCLDESSARAVLVTGEAGVGKSRLRYELIRRLKAQGELQLWIGRGDPLRAGAAFGLLAPAIRRTAGVLEGEPDEVRRDKLRARLARHLTGDDAARVTEFLGELVGVPFPDDASARLRSARHDPRLMSDQMRHAWEDWVRAETQVGPLVIVLEDLHWGDWPTVKFIDAILATLAERPILVLALARPDVKSLLPGLWEGRPVSEIALGSLSRRASERLVRGVLGETLGTATVQKLVDQAAGNALFLEELIRAAADGKGEALPESVLAMVQARLDRLPAEARRVLRAASVFSNLFWTSGVTALVGADLDVGEWIEFLIEQEVISRRGDRKFPSEDELVFRHALVRDAAYSLLTEADRRLGHQQAGGWLEKAGETDALILAEHFERGGELSRAANHYRRAAEDALEASDLVSTTVRAARGLACLDRAGVPELDEVRGALHLATAKAFSWNCQYQEHEVAAQRALTSLVPGTPSWCSAANEAAHAYGHRGDPDGLARIAGALCELGDAGAADRDYVLAAAGTEAHLLFCGQRVLGERLYEILRPLMSTFAEDPAVAAAILRVGAVRALTRGELADALACNLASVDAYERAGDTASAHRQRNNVGSVYIGLGAYAEAKELLETTVVAAERMGMSIITPVCRLNLGLTIGQLGDHATARVVLARAVDEFVLVGDHRCEAEAHADLSLMYRRGGDLAAAAREAERAVELSAAIPTALGYCLGHRAQVSLAVGRVDLALADARRAMDILETGGGLDRTDGEALVRLTWAEALHASGDHAGAARAIAHARARVEEVAGHIGDPAWRQSFVDRVADNARTLALDRAWNPA